MKDEKEARNFGTIRRILRKSLPNGLFPLGFPDFGLLIPLGHDVLKGGSNDGPLELVGPLRPLLGGLLLLTLLVLATVEHGPVDLARVALEEVSAVGSTVQELEGPSIGPDQGSAPARVDFVSTVRTKFDPEMINERLCRFI